MSDDNEGQDYKGEFVATGGRSEIRRPSELVPSKPLARMPRRPCFSQPPPIDVFSLVVDEWSVFLFAVIGFKGC